MSKVNCVIFLIAPTCVNCMVGPGEGRVPHPWSSPHLISGISRKSGKIFKQSGISGISGKPVKYHPEYPENLINQVRKIQKTQKTKSGISGKSGKLMKPSPEYPENLSGISGKPIKPCPDIPENPENYSSCPEYLDDYQTLIRGIIRKNQSLSGWGPGIWKLCIILGLRIQCDGLADFFQITMIPMSQALPDMRIGDIITSEKTSIGESRIHF